MTRTVTALRAAGPGRVAVELDGERWRMLPLEAVVKAGLSKSLPLDRPRIRVLARELRRLHALKIAARALRARDRSTDELDLRLRTRGVRTTERERVLGTLISAGLVDDVRFATSRARVLASRGSGDELIRYELEQRGITGEIVDAALAAIDPERERVEEVVRRRGASAKTIRFLSSRGFAEESLEGVAAGDLGDAIG